MGRTQAREGNPGVMAHGSRASSLRASIAYAQGGYFLLTGLWPLLSIKTFQLVTGPKTDLWLVKTVGVVVAAIGATLIMAGSRRQQAPEIPLLGISSAAALGGIDLVYVAKGRIARVYLLDALAEAGLIACWLAELMHSRQQGTA